MIRPALMTALATTAALNPVSFSTPARAQSAPSTQCAGFKIDVTRTTPNQNSSTFGDHGTLTVRPDCYYSGMVGVANYLLFGITNGPAPTATVPSTTAPNGVIYGCVEKNSTGAWILVPNKKVCGTQTAQTCQTLAVNESTPWATAGQITLPGSPKKLISITGQYTVAAANGLPSETKTILNPPPAQPNQRKAGPYPLSLSNKYINIFMLPNPTPLPPISQSGAANYVTMNQALVPGSYLVPGMSLWPDGTIHAHGNITGTVTLCVQ
jgi:hypothetical protein